jgi:hypothetical protein
VGSPARSRVCRHANRRLPSDRSSWDAVGEQIIQFNDRSLAMSYPNRPYLSSASVALACFITGYATLTLPATSATDAGANSSTVAQDKVNFYLYRDPNIKVPVTTTLAVNGKEIEVTKRTTCGHWEVNPGTYDISSESPSHSTVRIVAEAGKSYYVWQEVKISMGLLPTNELHVVDADTGRRGVLACGRFLETAPVETP